MKEAVISYVWKAEDFESGELHVTAQGITSFYL